jgi:hypothetical protein
MVLSPAGVVCGYNLALLMYFSLTCLSKAVNSYQPANTLFCVRAEYRRSANDTSRVIVFNQGRRGSVGGALQSGGTFLLNAIAVDEGAGKLAVGPPFLPTRYYGPYWVVAADMRPYTWAIISGGPPTSQGSNNTCRTASSAYSPNGNGEGLWRVQGTLETIRPLIVCAGCSSENLAQVRKCCSTFEKSHRIRVMTSAC